LPRRPRRWPTAQIKRFNLRFHEISFYLRKTVIFLVIIRLLEKMHLKAFREQVLPLQDTLYRLAHSILHNREEAEDAVQESLIKLWTKREELEKLASIKFYALRITRNYCLDKIKLRKNIVGEIDYLKIQSLSSTPEQHLEIKNLITTIQDILKLLPEQQRVLVHLRNVEELSFEEIASITDLSINNIRVTLSRARKNINEIYEKHFNRE